MKHATAPDRPEVSVVVASFSGEAVVDACLKSLETQSAGMEVIVSTGAADGVVCRLQGQFPAVRFVRASAGESVFRLRTHGLNEAGGRIVVLIEDHCTVSPGWIDALCGSVACGHPVVGGTVDNGLNRRIYDWALFCCEYAAFMPPMASGTVPYLPAVNTAYRRELLAACQDVWREAFYENEVHDALAAAGHTLYLEEKALVRSHLTMPPGAAVSHFFAGGKRFGHYRGGRFSLAVRLLRALAGPAVPLVLLARVFRVVAARRPDRLAATLLGLPFLFCFLAAWSAGEAAGYLTRRLRKDSQRDSREIGRVSRQRWHLRQRRP